MRRSLQLPTVTKSRLKLHNTEARNISLKATSGVLQVDLDKVGKEQSIRVSPIVFHIFIKATRYRYSRPLMLRPLLPSVSQCHWSQKGSRRYFQSMLFMPFLVRLYRASAGG